jgi:subtilase family serine protease
MIRKLSTLLTIVVVVSVMNIAGHAQSHLLLTRHVREVTQNGLASSVGRLPANQSMRLVLVLPLRSQETLDAFLKELYDPSSPNYRHFLTVEQFAAMFGPARKDYEAVIRFAKTHGFEVVGTSSNRLNVNVTASVVNIEQAFHVTMGVYHHPTENRTFYAPDREPTPDLAVRLWHISGLDNYSIPKPNLVRRVAPRSEATTGSCPEQSFCGSDMRAAYYGGTTLTGTGQSIGLLEYAGTDLTDLARYYKNAGQTNNVPILIVSTDGTPTKCVEPFCDDTEQTIDMTQALGMAPGLANLVMYVGSSDCAIFNAMATANPLNSQLSSSYYWNPADPQTDDPYFMEFAAQGQTLFDAAGDRRNWQESGSIWPADDALIVSVGGTDLKTSSAGGPWAWETAWSDSGGGISPNRIPIPSWQVPTATQCIDPCSRSLRNGPDVAANSNFTFYVCADQTTCTANVYGGTSFAAPMWAGYLALANQQALAHGSPPLGLINSDLYTIGLSSSYHTDFHDITSGSNGYNATMGYDLATGWGSPNGSSLIDALTSGQVANFSISASPTRLKIARGSSGTSTITTAISGGFDASITLTASSAEASLDPSTIPAPGAGTSTMTVKIGRNAQLGKHRINVIGTGGGLSCSVAVIVDIVR